MQTSLLQNRTTSLCWNLNVYLESTESWLQMLWYKMLLPKIELIRKDKMYAENGDG